MIFWFTAFIDLLGRSLHYGLGFSLWYSLGRLSLTFEMPKAAEDFFRRGLAIFPDHYGTNLRVAELYVKARKFEMALHCYRQAFYRRMSYVARDEVAYFSFLNLLKTQGHRAELVSLLIGVKNLHAGDHKYWHNPMRELAKENEFALLGELTNRLLPTARSLRQDIFDVLSVSTIDDLIAKKQCTIEEHLASDKFKFKLPLVFGESVSRADLEITVPSSTVAEIRDVAVLPSSLVMKDGVLVVYEPAAHPKLGGTISGCWRYLQGSPLNPGKAFVHCKTESELTLERAVLLTGRSQSNYFHWMVEYLPRMWAVMRDSRCAGVPLLVNAEMPYQHYEALRFLLSDVKFVIQYCNDNTTVRCRELLIPSIQTFLPDDPDIPYRDSAALSPTHIHFMREKVLAGIDRENGSIANSEMPKKIFVIRGTGAAHNVTNEMAIARVLVQDGFTIVTPQALSFQEQVAYFRNAEVLVVTSGAALTNLLFCKPGAKVYSLIHERNKDFCLYSNIAQIVGAEFTYITGAPTRPRSEFKQEIDYVFSSFYIPVSKVVRAIAT